MPRIGEQTACIEVVNYGLQSYQTIWQDMQVYTLTRTVDTADQLWLVEHPPVYTLGLNGKSEHLLNNSQNIPLIHSDRGGQITYHGPGQLIIYTLFDLKRLGINIREMVTALEKSMISTLAYYNIQAIARPEAPGVYVNQKKIGSIGLRIKNQCCYHGLSLNNNMDLTPFSAINPCGYAGLQMTQLVDLGVHVDNSELANILIQALTKNLS